MDRTGDHVGVVDGMFRGHTGVIVTEIEPGLYLIRADAHPQMFLLMDAEQLVLIVTKFSVGERVVVVNGTEAGSAGVVVTQHDEDVHVRLDNDNTSLLMTRAGNLTSSLFQGDRG